MSILLSEAARAARNKRERWGLAPQRISGKTWTSLSSNSAYRCEEVVDWQCRCYGHSHPRMS
jgi:hypothetical protein